LVTIHLSSGWPGFAAGCDPTDDDQVEVTVIMRALDPEVVDAAWAAVEALVPAPPRTHPLGCHRRRVPDRVCFEAMLVRLVTGCSWVVAERLTGGVVSDTTLRARRDEWITAGVFNHLAEQALDAYDRIIGLDLTNTAIDGSQHKAPGGGPGTGPNCTDRGRRGWKWSLATDTAGIPVGWVAAAANTNDCTLVAATLDTVTARGLTTDITTLHMDRGYDFAFVRRACTERGLTDVVIPPVRPPGRGRTKKPVPLGLRWPIERTNSWLSNYGQLRRNTDRHPIHRHTQLCLAIALLLIAKLIDWRNRWSPIR
jgi:transposase